MKVLIAEDEPVEREALRRLLLRHYAGVVKEVLVVDNGSAAVETAWESHPDLVFMDIRMPGTDGLVAGREIRAFNQKAQIIMLSAYSDFEYARQSIHNGALDYIVKPYSVKTLREAVDKAISRISKSRRDDADSETSRRATDMLQREFLHKVMVNFRLRGDIIEEYARMIGVYDCGYRVLFFQDDGNRRPDSDMGDELFRRLANRDIRYMRTYFSHSLCVIPYSPSAGDLEEPLDGIVSYVMHKHPGRAYLASAVQDEWESLAVVFYETLNRLINRKNHSPAEYAALELEERLSEAVISRSESEAGDICRMLVDAYYKKYATSNDFGFSVIGACRNLLRSVFAVNNQALEKMWRDFDTGFAVPYRGDREQALADLLASVGKIISSITQNIQGKNAHLMRGVKKYIDEHYGEYISLDHIARHVSMSKYYLSRTFKSLEGENIITYLQRVRIEKAKALLLKGETPAEVCYKCGFSDPAYFGKSFKKLTGTSPVGFVRQSS